MLFQERFISKKGETYLTLYTFVNTNGTLQQYRTEDIPYTHDTFIIKHANLQIPTKPESRLLLQENYKLVALSMEANGLSSVDRICGIDIPPETTISADAQ